MTKRSDGESSAATASQGRRESPSWRRAALAVLTITTLLALLTSCGASKLVGAHVAADPAAGEALERIDDASAPSGVDPATFEALRAELRRVVEARDAERSASAASSDAASATYLALDLDSGDLAWAYRFTGDYDQNGEVNISDLTPLGAHLGERGPFDPGSISAVIDGDNNGEINIADVTPIGAHFEDNTVIGYNIYRSTNYSDVPQDGGEANGGGAELVATVPISASSSGGRRQFSYAVAGGPAGAYYWVRLTDGAMDGAASNCTAPAGDTLTPDGGAVQLGELMLSLPPDAAVQDLKFSEALEDPPAGYPSDFIPVGQAHDISVDHPELLNAPVVMTLHYDDTGMGADEENVMVLHYNGSEYEPATLHSADPAANTVTFDSRVFSPFVVGYVTSAILDNIPATYTTGFTAAANGWNIDNFGNDFSGGNCLGMSAYAAWFYNNHSGNLFGKYDTSAGEPISIAHLTATRAHMAQSQYWSSMETRHEFKLGAKRTGQQMRYFISHFDEPLILSMYGKAGDMPMGHACVVYGWDATGFLFYDVNYKAKEQHVNWSAAAGFGNYAGGFAAPGFNEFFYVSEPSLGRTEDFQALTTEAEGGFTSSSDISLAVPFKDEQVTGDSTDLVGSLSGSLGAETRLVCYDNGMPENMQVIGGVFDTTVPVASGKNTLVLIAGVDPKQQSNWCLHGATLVREFTGTRQPAKMTVTLTWDQDKSDADLYVIEPDAEIHQEWVGSWRKTTHAGMKLNIENTTGFGPEQAMLSTDAGGTAQPGLYKVAVCYYKDYEKEYDVAAISGRVRVVLNEGTPQMSVKTYPFKLTHPSMFSNPPFSPGANWQQVAAFKLIP